MDELMNGHLAVLSKHGEGGSHPGHCLLGMPNASTGFPDAFACYRLPSLTW